MWLLIMICWILQNNIVKIRFQWKIQMELTFSKCNSVLFSPQVALKVGCPTDGTMVACLKSTDAKTLTMAALLT